MPHNKHISLWEGTISRENYPPLDQDIDVDVAVIGAGITGLTTAYLLKQSGYSVAVLESNHVGSGTTGYTSAHLTNLWDEGYREIIDQQGIEIAQGIESLMAGAIDTIETIIRDEGIECDFKRLSGYYYAPDSSSEDSVRETFEACTELGLEVSLINESPLPFPTNLTMEIKNQARFHPLRYLDALAKRINGGGSHVFEGSRVIDFSDGKPCRLSTGKGKVSAEKVVMATHLPLGVNPLQARAAPYRSFVIAFKAAQALPMGLYWDTSSPYYYTRGFRQGNESLILVGGEDRKTAHGSEKESFRSLREYIHQRYEVEEVKFEWSAQFFTPADRMPFIGISPFLPHTYVATGFSGDGLTMGTASAAIICDHIKGVTRPGTEIFSPSRLNLKGLKRFAEENYDVAKHFIKDRISLPGPEKIEHLRRGEGCVVTTGMSQIAAYRTEQGNVRKFSAVCPHLKCIVHWNDALKTFDCPCHGSRFDTNGSVQEGPALKGLSEL